LQGYNLFSSFDARKQRTSEVMTSLLRTSEMIREASYKVAEFIVKGKKPHKIAEILSIPACKGIVKIVLGPEATNQSCCIS
jgi:hypothetical protein